jgi:5-methylcytosine-specific restriction endonuclease McrA
MGIHLKNQRVRQFEHQSGLCCWCLQPMELRNLTAEEWTRRGDYLLMATWEHVLPKSLGGGNSRRNRVLAHRKCNQKRGNKIREPHFKPYPGRGETGSHRSQLPMDQLQRISSITEGSNPSGPTI